MRTSRRAAALRAGVVLLAAGILPGTLPADQGRFSRSRCFAEALRRKEGRTVFRAPKATPTGESFLRCHGSSREENLARRIRELYPGYRAVGFRAGELRRAFSVRVPLGLRCVPEETVSGFTQEGGSP